GSSFSCQSQGHSAAQHSVTWLNDVSLTCLRYTASPNALVVGGLNTGVSKTSALTKQVMQFTGSFVRAAPLARVGLTENDTPHRVRHNRRNHWARWMTSLVQTSRVGALSPRGWLTGTRSAWRPARSQPSPPRGWRRARRRPRPC